MAGAKQQTKKEAQGHPGRDRAAARPHLAPDLQGRGTATRRQRRQNRFDRPPSWRSALNRAILAAGVFLAVLVLVLKQDFAPGVQPRRLVMFVVYIPLGYLMDSSIYRFRQRRKQNARPTRSARLRSSGG